MVFYFGIVGSRRYFNEEIVRETVRELFTIFEDELGIVSGGCKGVDSWAVDEAIKIGVPINQIIVYRPILINTRSFYEIVKRYYDRNKKIAKRCDFLIAFPAEDRKGGTESTIKYAKQFNKPIMIR